MAQAWEREVKGKHQGFFDCGMIEKPVPGGYNLL